MSKITELKALWEEVAACDRCSIATIARNKVFGDGNVKSRLVLVGEAPGMEEDKTGSPFVGNAGQILRLALFRAGLNPEKLFICNVLKCHPPEVMEPEPSGNRKPSKQEIANCLPFLKRQLNIIQPRIIVALGATAASALLDSKRPVEVTKSFGKVMEKDGRKIIIAYHPQYLGYKAGTNEGKKLEKDYVALFRRIGNALRTTNKRRPGAVSPRSGGRCRYPNRDHQDGAK